MRSILITVLAALLACCPGHVRAQANNLANAVQPPVGPPATSSSRTIDPTDLAAYIDGVVQAHMRDDGVAGAVVTVVDRQGTLLLRGYGMASQQPLRAVDPMRTVFRIGSISKTFSYLEALRLIDAGKLRLDAEVNDYLPVALKLKADAYAPVRLRNLLTHTAGYEDSFDGMAVDDPSKALPLDEYLVRHRPARVREPGLHAVYSNYSVGLLGALLTHVEGVDFETLMERTYFDPLGMHLTTFRAPLNASDPRNAPAKFDQLWSQGFKRENAGFVAQRRDYLVAPFGGLSSTGADMARYMSMLLHRGELDGVRVLPQSAFDRLEGEPLFRNTPQSTGISYGFFQRRYGQVESIEHGGDTVWFHSNLVVVPKLGIGIFVSTNTGTGAHLAYELPELLIERYFPTARATSLPAPPKGFDTQRFVGNYTNERTAYSTFEKVMMYSSDVSVTAPGDGTLVVSNGDVSSRWTPEGGLSFRKVEGQGRINFFADSKGRISGFADAYGETVLVRAGLASNVLWLYAMLAASGVTALAVLAGAWWRRRNASSARNNTQRVATWMYLTSVGWLLFTTSLGVAAVRLLSPDATYAYPDLWLRMTLWFGTLVIGLTVACLPGLVSAWRSSGWTSWRKLRHTCAVAIFTSTCVLMWIWNLLGWKV